MGAQDKNAESIGGGAVMKSLWPLLLYCWFLTAYAAQELYPFDSAAESAQFSALTAEIRCLVCQNQAISDSNAPFAADLRAEIYTLVKAHKTTPEIKQHLTQRYGDYVLLQPPVAKQTTVLWLAPFLLLFIGLAVLYRAVKKGA